MGKKTVADESAKTRKAREKLKKQIESVQMQVTEQALEKKTLEMHRWIARHAQSRVPLKSKAISLFDENQNTAKLSLKVAQLAEQLNKQNVKNDLSENQNDTTMKARA